MRFSSEPTRVYHLYWLKLWPVLPGLLPTVAMLHGTDDAIEFMAAGLLTLVLVGIATWLATLKRMRWPTAIIVVTLSAINSAIAYGLFRA